MKLSEVLAFAAGAATAVGVTLLFTTEKGKEIRTTVTDKLSKEEIDKLIAKLKKQRAQVIAEEEIATEATVEDLLNTEID